jgi:hypothetical protein
MFSLFFSFYVKFWFYPIFLSLWLFKKWDMPDLPTLTKCLETNRVRPKSTSAIVSHSRQAINEFPQSKPFHSGYNQLPRVQAITASSIKPTSSIPSYSGQTKTYFLLFKPFQSNQKGIPLFQDIPERQKLTSDIPRHSRQEKTDIRQSRPFNLGQNWPRSPIQAFRSVQNWLSPFQAIPVRSKPTSSIPSYSKQYCQYIFPSLLALSQLVIELFSSCFS